MQFISDYFLGDSGGGSWFSMYKKASILVGDPEMFSRPNTKAFNYRLFFKNKEIKNHGIWNSQIKFSHCQGESQKKEQRKNIFFL